MKVKFPFHLKDLKIKLQRNPCFGTCPFYDVTLYGTGVVIYNGEHFVTEVGERRDEVNPWDLLELFQYAVEVGFFEMQADYEFKTNISIDDNLFVKDYPYTYEDLPSSQVTIDTGKQLKSVLNYLGAPKRLITLENKIEKLANTKRWVKGIS
jgi:hypothetical protein